MPKTHRIASPVLGPYVKWVSGFIKVSAESFSLLDHVQRPEILDLHTFFNLSVNAEATSLAARVAATHSLAVPAFALARVRLEQCIISSFLIHAPQEQGIRRYLGHQPVRMNTVFKKHESHFQTGWDMANLEKDAHLAQARFKDSRFKREWTPLLLPEMAERHDALAKEVSPLPWKLADEYWGLYPIASVLINRLLRDMKAIREGTNQATDGHIKVQKSPSNKGQSDPARTPRRLRYPRGRSHL